MFDNAAIPIPQLASTEVLLTLPLKRGVYLRLRYIKGEA